MNNAPVFPVFLGLIGLTVLARWIADRLDRERIRNNLAERGCKVLEIHWAPFGPGWFGEKSDRIYEVWYENQAGVRVAANCKTSLFSGVYWHNQSAPAPDAANPPATEPLICLACGKSMGGRTTCPACGWSYKT